MEIFFEGDLHLDEVWENHKKIEIDREQEMVSIFNCENNEDFLKLSENHTLILNGSINDSNDSSSKSFLSIIVNNLIEHFQTTFRKKIPRGKNFLFYIIRQPEKKFIVFIALSGFGKSGKVECQEEFLKYQQTFNNAIAIIKKKLIGYEVTGEFVPLVNKADKILTRVTPAKFKRGFEKSQSHYLRSFLILKLLDGELQFDTHFCNTIFNSSEIPSDFFTNFSITHQAKKRFEKLLKNNNNPKDINSLTILILKKIAGHEECKNMENSSTNSYDDKIARNLKYLIRQCARIHKIDSNVSDIFENAEEKEAFSYYRRCLKKVWLTLSKTDIYDIIRFQSRCSEDNLIDWLRDNTGVLKEQGSHFIFSVENKKLEKIISIRPPCIFCMLHFSVEFDLFNDFIIGHLRYWYDTPDDWRVSNEIIGFSDLLQYLEIAQGEHIVTIFHAIISILAGDFIEVMVPQFLNRKTELENGVRKRILDLIARKNVHTLLPYIDNLFDDTFSPNKLLWESARYGSTEVIEYLIKTKEVFFEKFNDIDGTAMHLAINNGHLKSAEKLIEFAKSFTFEDENHLINIIFENMMQNTSVVEVASCRKTTETFMLLKKSIEQKIFSEKIFKSNCLHYAVIASNVEMLKVICDVLKLTDKENVRKIQEKIFRNHTLLEFACLRGDCEVLSFLLKNIYPKDNRGTTENFFFACSYALSQGNLNIVDFLAKTMKDRKMTEEKEKLHEWQSKGGFSSPHYIALHGRKDLFETFSEKSNIDSLCSRKTGSCTDLKISDKFRETQISNGTNIIHDKLTPLHCAVLSENAEMIMYLLGKCEFVDEKNSNGDTPLHYAASWGHLKNVEILLKDNRVDINSRNSTHETPLMIAASHGFVDIVNLMLAKNADVNAYDISGKTPLIYAIDNSEIECTKLLLSRTDTVPHDSIALYIAVQNCCTDIVGLLLEKGANVNAIYKEGQTVLHLAVDKNNEEIIIHLLEKGMRRDIQCDRGWTPLHLAIVRNHSTASRCMLDFDRNINANCSDSNIESFLNLKTKDGRTALHFAVMDNNIDAVKLLIKHKANIEAKNEDGLTPLHLAVKLGHWESMDLLLENGDINAKSLNLETLLHTAADTSRPKQFSRSHAANANYIDPLFQSDFVRYRYRLSLIILLLENNVDVNSVTDEGSTPLHIAAQNGDNEIVRILLKYNAKTNLQTFEKLLTPLHCAVQFNHLDVAHQLQAMSADLNAIDCDGFTPLMKATSNGNLDIVKSLVENGADINSMNFANFSSLHIAVFKNYQFIVSYLLKNNADVNIVGVNGFTPLHIAAQNGFSKIVEILHEHGADINVKTFESFGLLTPLHCAVQFNHLDVAFHLQAMNADLNAINSKGFTPLIQATSNGNLDIAKSLVESGADINSKNLENLSSLHIAVFKNDQKLVECLLENNADVNIVNENGFTPLHIAAQYGFVDIVYNLFEHGADVNLKTFESFGLQTPLHLAANFNHLNVVTLLTVLNADLNTTDSFGNTPILKATYMEHLDIVRALAEGGADIEFMNFERLAPLHIAVYKKNISIVESLSEYHASVNIHGKEGYTPLHIAAEDGNVECAEILLNNGALVDSKTDNFGDLTSLHLAVQKKEYLMIEYLLAHQADVFATNISGENAIQMATNIGDEKILKILSKD